MAVRILGGITVLDVGSFIAGPAAATVMAEFGAEVIKVEPPGGGDPYRDLVKIPGMPLSERNYPWLLHSRNKKSLALDLKVPEGREALLKLVARADVYLLYRCRDGRWFSLVSGDELLAQFRPMAQGGRLIEMGAAGIAVAHR
jgi:crotonobetainyl-CoA:carnitine CoA-transferase CaiB-like acyl-CoA transferase